jgi:hypothetical protein
LIIPVSCLIFRDDERFKEIISHQKLRLQKMQDNLAMMEAADELKELRKR